MAILISKDKKAETLLVAVERISGVHIMECLQCKKCSNGCAVAGIAKTTPAEIIRKLQLNAGDELLESDLVWMCVSCVTCYARCPMKIDMAAIMDALRIIATQRKNSRHKLNVPYFNKSCLNTVRLFGRTYDLGMIAAYKIGTSNYMQDTERFPMMLKKRKIALFPSFKGNKKFIKQIFKVKEKEN